MNEFIEQCQFDEDRGLLPSGYTKQMIKQLNFKQLANWQKEEIAGENKYNLNGGEI